MLQIDDTVWELGEVIAELEALYGEHIWVQPGMQRDPLTLAEWRAQMEAWSKQRMGPETRQASENIPGVCAHPVELRADKPGTAPRGNRGELARLL